jgi:hypothetical protein
MSGRILHDEITMLAFGLLYAHFPNPCIVADNFHMIKSMATMACLYALEGPGVVDADLVLTFHQDESKNKVPLFLASKLGFKVYNIAGRKQLSEVATFLKS